MWNKMYSIKQVAEKLKISEATVRRLIKSQKLAFYKIGQQLRISDADLNKYIHDRYNTAKGERDGGQKA